MNRDTYLAKRETLLNEARALIEQSDLNGYKAKKDEIEALDRQFDEEAQAQAALNALENRQQNPQAVQNLMNLGGSVVTTGQMQPGTGEQTPDDPLNSVEYRRAFMNYVAKGTAIPHNLTNQNQVTKSTDAGALIPTIVVEKIIEKAKSLGTILSLVTKTNFPGGVKIPVSQARPTATWVAEGEGSDKQKLSIQDVVFAYYKLRCAVAMTFEVANLSLDIFEAHFIQVVSEAMVEALEQAIINGSGSGQPKGILKETPDEGQAIEVAADGKLDYALLCEAEGALPEAYEADSVWLMSKKTFMQFEGMVDNNGQPIARTNYGLGGKPERYLLGRLVAINSYMPDYKPTVEADTIFAAIFRMKDYDLNYAAQMVIKTYEDNDTDDTVTKAILLADGKVLDKSSLVTLTKKQAG
mgnify:FL=1